MVTHALRLQAAGVLAALGIASSAALALAWHDVLPGGWRLRGLVEPHALREARERALYLAQRVSAFRREGPDCTERAVVFLGSSTIERCPLPELFPGCRTLNRGVAWARAAELARSVNVLLPSTEPAAIVLYAGGPDRVAAPLAVDVVLASVEQLAEAVRARAPRTPVLLLGLLPGTHSPAAEVEALARIDAGLARIAEQRGFAHLRLSASPLVDASGALVETLSTDGLHLTRTGYELLAESLRAAPEPFATLFSG